MREDLPAIVEALGDRIGELAEALVGCSPTTRGRTEWRFRTRGSLAVCVGGANRGAFFDHEAGTGGDALELVRHLRQTGTAEGLRWAAEWLGGRIENPATPRATKPSPDRPKPATIDLARAVWREAVAPSRTLVETYLRARGLSLPDDAPLRFHPACPRGAERLPAMVALMTNLETGAPCGVHRTFLRPDGAGKVEHGTTKAMLGVAGVVRLSPDADVLLGLGLVEGIETGLSVMQRAGWRPVWAATSAGGIARFPVLLGLESLTVFADADAPGLAAARVCCQRWVDAGREARILAPPVGDWDDQLESRGTAA